MNEFLKKALEQGAETLSGNFAKKYSKVSNPLLDQFGKISGYLHQRDIKDIFTDQQALWDTNKKDAVKFILYLRLISRKPKLLNGKKLQKHRGAGLKHEAIVRMLHLHYVDKNAFYKILPLFVVAGSWKDIFQLLRYDWHIYKAKVLDWDLILNFVMAGLENPEFSDLVKKYMPHRVSYNKAKTAWKQANNEIATLLAKKLGLTPKQYRQLKSSGKAHKWQQLISKKLFDQIDFNQIPGKALLLLTSSNFITNHGLEDKLDKFLRESAMVKFNGLITDLVSKLKSKPNSLFVKKLVNLQYRYIVDTNKIKTINSRYITAIDTSGSMQVKVPGTNVEAIDVAAAIGSYTAEYLEGPFKDAYITFGRGAETHRFLTKEFDSRIQEVRKNSLCCDTNFQAIIHEIIKVWNQGVDISHFPNGLIAISDGEFNPSGAWKRFDQMTNVEAARKKMLQAGMPKDYVENFVFVFWDIRNSYYANSSTKFETYDDHKGVIYMSGYDPQIVAFLLGTDYEENSKAPKSAEELLEVALNQPLLKIAEGLV